jgi:hypothetical protein
MALAATQLSAVLRDQLMSELKDVKSVEDATIWARRILPAKNSLDATDARQIEDAFQAKLAVVQEATDQTDGLASAVMAAPKAERAQGSTRKSRPASIDKVAKLQQEELTLCIRLARKALFIASLGGGLG